MAEITRGEPGVARLVELLQNNRADLEARYQRVLRENLFTSRVALRPNMVPGIAAEELQAVLDFLGPALSPASAHGSHLYQLGLSERVLLLLGQALRLFFLPSLDGAEIVSMLEIVDSYQADVLHGFIASLEKSVFTEQELTRKAFERASHHD